MKKLYLFAFLMLSSFSCTAQIPNFLADKHVHQKISCESCHGVNNSTGEERCIYCHGNMDKIGEKSQGKFTVNPHAPHGAHEVVFVAIKVIKKMKTIATNAMILISQKSKSLKSLPICGVLLEKPRKLTL